MTDDGFAPKRVTKDDVATLLANFDDYVNPDGDFDPWFTLDEINQQFAWNDVGKIRLKRWLGQFVQEGSAVTEIQEGERVWRWRS